MQIEAALGGHDVVQFCGGLAQVLAAAGVPVHKALAQATPAYCPQGADDTADPEDSQGSMPTNTDGDLVSIPTATVFTKDCGVSLARESVRNNGQVYYRTCSHQ